MTNSETLKFMYERLINIHGENSASDYMIKLEEVMDWIEEMESETFGTVWENGYKIKIWPVDNYFVISWGDCWFPGAYDSKVTALGALTKDECAIGTLIESLPVPRIITVEMLREIPDAR